MPADMCQAVQLAVRVDAAIGGQLKDPTQALGARVSYVVVVTIEPRGASGLGVLRTPWAWMAKSSKTFDRR